MGAPRVITFGCRLNAFESELMREHAGGGEGTDTVIVNTCAVTAEATRQARQAIRKAARETPEARLIVTGCAAQIEPERFAAMDGVDLVLGNEEKLKAENFRTGHDGSGDAAQVRVGDIMDVSRAAPEMIESFGTRARAYVQVQTGCDHRCTFCVIPFGRGNSRSVGPEAIVGQIARLVEAGTREVVLTGVDITAYGRDLPEAELSLGVLVRTILARVPGLSRLRLSSIDSIEADEALMTAIAEEERLMPHFHLSLQSGDDVILKRMKRRHLAADARAFVAEVTRLRPDAVFGADLIAGFPTETEAMFDNTLAHVDDCALTYLHVFPFSPRPGTPAARMPQLERGTIKERAARLRARGARRLHGFLDSERGREREVLMETRERGRTPQFVPVALASPRQPGDIVTARLGARDGDGLAGQAVA